MATYKDLIAKARRMVVDYPDKKNAIIDLVEMCRDEIADGGSESHEVEMALEDLGDIENKARKNRYNSVSGSPLSLEDLKAHLKEIKKG